MKLFICSNGYSQKVLYNNLLRKRIFRNLNLQTLQKYFRIIKIKVQTIGQSLKILINASKALNLIVKEIQIGLHIWKMNK